MRSKSDKDAVKRETDNTAQFTISVDYVEEHERRMSGAVCTHSSSNDNGRNWPVTIVREPLL